MYVYIYTCIERCILTSITYRHARIPA